MAWSLIQELFDRTLLEVEKEARALLESPPALKLQSPIASLPEVITPSRKEQPMNEALAILALLQKLAAAAPELVAEAVQVYHTALNALPPNPIPPPPLSDKPEPQA